MNFRFTFPFSRTLFAGIATAALFAAIPSAEAQGDGQGLKMVVIDAGHGGPNFPGACRNGVSEKSVNLRVALMLGRLIEQEMPQIKVVYTRTTDKQFSTDLDKDLSARAEIANKAGADLFISIHANAVHSTVPRGVETVIMGESEVENRRNEAALYANNREELLDMSDQQTAAIVRAYIQNLQFTYGAYSEAMARIVQKHYEQAGYHNRGVKRQPLKVLYATDMPSILTEIGFMSNPAELKYISSEKGQQEIARALLEAVKEYAAYVESTRLQEEAPAATEERKQSAVAEERPAPAPKPAAEQPEAKPAPKPEKPAAPAAESGYTIQLLASASKMPVDSPELKSYRGKVKVYTSESRYRYKYCYGSYATQAAAAGDLAAVRKVFKDAYIVRYNGDRIVIN